MSIRAWIGAAILALLWMGGGAAGATRWTEEDFYRKAEIAHPSVVRMSDDLEEARSVVGNTRFYHVHEGDTFLDLARYYGLGYNEMEQANPGVDPWVPPAGQAIRLPTEWVLPQVPYAGVVVNIPEMRLYFFHPRTDETSPQLVSTYPVGLGREEWRTPEGEFRITGKTENPTWNIPVSIQKERMERDGYSPKMIPGSDPENPLGEYRLELSLPSYAIHGTNMPWGVGMQVSHGCIRLYPEDIEHLFPRVKPGMPGRFIYQPVKIGAREGRIYVEVHPDIYRKTPGLFREARRILQERGWFERVDQDRLIKAIEEKSGVPLDITAGSGGGDDLPEEDLRPARRETAPSVAPWPNGEEETPTEPGDGSQNAG